ncbi:MAG: 3-oxoacyl-ACP reductase FabG [Planctomycetota bacterium]|nr:3-oxoacyl-ACP reductase FabG [Planctomycetota bacterium]
MEFRDKIAVVTGASRGIGAATARAFAQQGGIVFANYPDHDADQHREMIHAWVSDAELDAERVIPIAADVSDAIRVQAMYAEIGDRCGRVDILINNAGINRDHTVIKMTDDEWRQVLAVNLDGTFFNCRAALPLLSDGGRIVNISSVVAHTGNMGVANYAASKAGILGLTKTLALELAGRNITVNAVCPGFVNTEMAQTVPPDILERLRQRVPLKRLADVEEVVACTLFLASAAASYVTGHSLNVNGGMHMM